MKLGYGNYSVQRAAEERCLFAELMERGSQERVAQAAEQAGSVAVEAMAAVIPQPRQPETAVVEAEAVVY